LTGVFALFAGLSSALIHLPVDAQGCAGGKCGITTTLTPSSGTCGSQVNLSIQSGAFPLDGKYEIWWSKSANMSDDPTSLKIAEGWNERLKQSVSIDIAVPEASNGTNYFHYIKAGRTEQMLNFSYMVTPSLVMQQAQVSAGTGQTASLNGTGFTAQDKITFFVDGEQVAGSTESNSVGSFSYSLSLPQLAGGTHVIRATAEKMFNQDASVKFKVAASIKVEPTTLIVGQPATVTGAGFTPNSEVSIKFDDKVVTASPSTDGSGRFVYNFNVPETTVDKHTVTAVDKQGNTAVWEMPVENNPPSTPTPISPTSDRFGIMGGQTVTFAWMPAKDDSGKVSYTIEVADNLNFFPLLPGMRRTNVTDTSVSMSIEPGTYYWRVMAADPSGNKSKWALSPYPFQVGLINMWVVIVANLVLVVVFILLLRTFIQRVRDYYY